jgi:hypothetical protein
LLLALVSAVILGSESRGLMTIFYCLRFKTPPTWRSKPPYLYTPGTEWPIYTPRHWVPFSSPLTTRRATVEAFEPVSTRLDCRFKIKVKFILRLAVYRQSLRLGVRPLEAHDQRFFPTELFCGNSPYVTSSLTRRWGCLLWIRLAFRQVYISHISSRWRWRLYVPPKRRFTYDLHGAISQKTVFFVVTAVKTSNLRRIPLISEQAIAQFLNWQKKAEDTTELIKFEVSKTKDKLCNLRMKVSLNRPKYRTPFTVPLNITLGMCLTASGPTVTRAGVNENRFHKRRSFHWAHVLSRHRDLPNKTSILFHQNPFGLS